MKLLIKPVFLCIAVFSLFSQSVAQSESGSLWGIVADSRGSAVKDARVILLYANKLAMRETLTNDRGEFGFDMLRPGDYAIAVEADGLTQSGGAQPIQIGASRELRIAIALTVAAIKDAVIVSATRTDSILGETPASAYVISATDLLRSQRISVFDALRYSPGVTAVQTGRRGGLTSLFMRGGESDYTKILIDGVPVNDAGGGFDFADLTTDNLARIELVRGAQSALYGSDAMSGVLQLLTHRGTTSIPEFQFSGEGGSFAYNRQFARISGANGPFDYSLSYTNLHTDGRDRNDDYQNRISTANLGYRFNNRTNFRVTARKDSSGLGTPGPTSVFFPDPDARARRKRIALGARIDDQTNDLWHQSLTFVYSESRYLSFDPIAQDLTMPGTPPDLGTAFNDFVTYFNDHQRRRGLRYQSDIVMSGGHFISAGVDYEQERAVFNNGFAGLNRVDSNRTNLGAFLQDQFSYGPRLYLTAGVRIENNRAEVPAGFAQILGNLGSTPYSGRVGFGTEVMPKISAIYVLRLSGIQSRRGPTRLKVNYGHGIKAPRLNEAFGPDQLFELGNPTLRPERSRNFDIGIEQFFLKDRIRVEGTYFDSRFRDQIAYVSDPATGGPIKLPDGRLTHYVNNDRARARGFELSIYWHPKRSLQFGGNYTLLDTRLVSAADVADYSGPQPKLVPNPEVSLPLLRRPRHSGMFYASWLGDKFDLNLYGLFVGKRRDCDPVFCSRFDAQNQPIYNKGYAKLDLTGSYRIKSWWSIFGRVENLLNRNYQEILGYPAYRRNFSAGMRFRFGGGK
jgi:outer membrane cobalamin receptor